MKISVQLNKGDGQTIFVGVVTGEDGDTVDQILDAVKKLNEGLKEN